ncbi:heavy metal-associated isoprenylated plant protein 8-like [Salvia miltiorrhiza]|uniref:heavy metal-associated isoprenylated plant protein 8-like n=1 Tax=Salvia miltiorrhiza TaxID=226208 RepID=UPI0025AD9A14|nr:heavy metal-associated isoprenylated plant protein 8-like [Salvia miltiorrhiza]
MEDYPNGVIILRVYIHCDGCRDEVLKYLRGYQGVEGVEIDAKNQKVIVKGENADPIKPPNVIETVLKINMLCDGCAKEVKCCIHGMEGVQMVDVDVENNLVRVKGSMDPHELVELISKNGGRNAEIVEQIDEEFINGEREGDCCHCYCYASQLVYEPQLFSDEDPNSCSVV